MHGPGAPSCSNAAGKPMGKGAAGRASGLGWGQRCSESPQGAPWMASLGSCSPMG